MNHKIAFVVIGQAGGNLGVLLEEKGYSVLYINTSEEDLSTLNNAKYKYHIPNGEGCNKDRQKAKQLIIEDFDQIASEIESKLKAEMIFIIFASGGGTGSGAGPMLIDLLLDEGRIIGAITILPAEHESVKAHINAYECFSELTQIPGTAACFILDNAKGNKLELNKEFVDSLDSFLKIPSQHKSILGNIDKAEIMETLQAHGMAMVIRKETAQSAQMIAAIQDTIFAPMEPDRTVKYITASLAGEVSMPELEKAVGTPIDTFQTFNNELSICCLSGLTYPQARLNEIYDKVAQSREIIQKNLEATKETAMKKGINFLEELDPVRTRQEKKPQSKRDIMSKYL